MQSSVPAHTDSMPVRLHHIVVDAHDLPGLARFWTQALGWTVLSEREREIVIGTDENAPVGMCFMPVTEDKAGKNRLHILTCGRTTKPPRSHAWKGLGRGASRSAKGRTPTGSSWPIRLATSSACCGR